MIERRQSVRVDCELSSSYRDLESGNPARAESAVVKNISRGGLKIRVDDFIPIHTRLHLSIELPTKRGLEVQVRPAWIVLLPHLNKYEIGARFVGIREDQEDAIENFQYKAILEKIPSRHEIVKDLSKDRSTPETGHTGAHEAS